MIDHSDWAHLRNIGFQDFHNDTPKPLANIAVAKTGYSNNTGYRDERGQISGLVFKDSTSTGGGISLRGTDDEHAIRNVLLLNCRIKDKPIAAAQDLALAKHVLDVRFAGQLNSANDTSAPNAITSPVELILDDGSPNCWAFAGKNLETLDVKDGHGGTSWRLGRLTAGTAAVYEPRLQGRYEVAVHWGTHEGVAEDAPWTVFHKGGYTTRTLDQNQSPGWHTLGEFDLAPDSWVRLVNPLYPITDAPVIADAVRFRRVDGATTSAGN
jgi:hypothetical protein